MADNVTADAGSGGAVFATDDIGSVHYPRSKVVWGPDGTANDADVASGKPLPIQLRQSDGTELVYGGGVEASALRVTIANDSTGVLTVDNAGTFATQVDGDALTALQLIDDTVVTLGTDTYTETTTKGNVIGAVRNDTLAALANTDNEIAPLQVNASGALYIQEGAALDVSAAAVPVTDNSGSLTVDNAGTFATQVDGDALTALQLIDDTVATLGTTTYTETTTKGNVIGAVRNDTLAALANTDNEIAPLQVNATGALYIQEGTALDVSAAAVPVTDNSGSLTVDNAGTFATQVDGDALTALQLIDDTVATLGTTTYTETTTKGNVIGAVRNDTLAALANTDNEIAPLQVNATGALYIQEGTALDVSAAAVPVTDNSGSLTVDNAGTFATQVDGAALTALQIIDNSILADSAPFSLGSSSVNMAGAIRDDALGSLTAVETDAVPLRVNVRGALWTHDESTYTLGTDTYTETSTYGTLASAVRNDTLAALADTDNEVAPLQVNASGALYTEVATQPARDRTTDNVGVAIQTDALMDDTTALTPKYEFIDDAVSGNNTIVSAVVGKKIRVIQMAFVCAAAVTVRFEDGAGGTALTGQMEFAANSGMSTAYCPVGLFETSANTLLNMELSGATSVDGWLVYVEV